MTLQEICTKSLPIIKKAGHFIQSQAGEVKAQEIEHKALNDLVSYVDKKAEQILVEGLQKILPESTFLTEEKTIEQKEGDWRWIIDPLDGTTNFLHQIPPYSVSVALQYKAQTVLGIVYEVTGDELFYAWKDGGAFLNDTPIKVSSTHKLLSAVAALGFVPGEHIWMEDFLQFFHHLIKNTQGVRRHGSAATDLAYTACGRFDTYIECNVNAWDVAAGAFILQEAGGRVTDFRGGEDYLFGRSIIASNGLIHTEVLEVLQSYFRLALIPSKD